MAAGHALPDRHRDLGHLRRRNGAHRRAWASTPTTRRCSTAWPARAAGASGAHAKWPSRLARVGHQGAYEGALKLRRQSRPDLAHALRAPSGRDRRVPRHARGVPQLPHRRQARLRAAPLGTARRRVRWIVGAGGMAVIAHPGRYKFTRQRGIRAVHRVQGARRPRRRGGDGQPQPRRLQSSTPTSRASSTCTPRAAATSIRPTKATPTSARCRRCRRPHARVGRAAGAHPLPAGAAAQ